MLAAFQLQMTGETEEAEVNLHPDFRLGIFSEEVEKGIPGFVYTKHMTARQSKHGLENVWLGISRPNTKVKHCDAVVGDLGC